MPIQLDFRSGVPIYIQIMDQIRQMVANGDLRTGDQLPTVRQLAIDLQVNWNTVARAYRLLDEAGLISTQQGQRHIHLGNALRGNHPAAARANPGRIDPSLPG